MPTPTPTPPAPLEPSELGTKEYWDELYGREKANHEHDASDTGTVWFEDAGAQAKVTRYLSSLAAATGTGTGTGTGTMPGVRLDRRATSFLDLGSGNGASLWALRDDGWRGRMLGVDYSRPSVELARRIAAQRRSRTGGRGTGTGTGTSPPPPPPPPSFPSSSRSCSPVPDVEFEEYDILSSSTTTASSSSSSSSCPASPQILTGAQAAGWDVVLDKGTFDAISLSAQTTADGRRVGERYRDAVLPLVADGGLLLLTSCNWTEEELRGWLERAPAADPAAAAAAAFRLVGRVDYPRFSFGGVKGQAVTTLCFRKVTRVSP